MRVMLTFEVIYEYMIYAAETGRAQLDEKGIINIKERSGSKVSVKIKKCKRAFLIWILKKNSRALELCISKVKAGGLDAGYPGL